MLNIPVYTIESPVIGKIQITINDPNAPMWRGKYQTGKLSIYYGDVIEGESLCPVVPLIYILTEQDIPELNCMGCQVYSKSYDLFAIKADLMQKIDDHYTEFLLEYKKQNEPILH